MKLQQVKEYNQECVNRKAWIQVFTLGTGAMHEEPRTKGYVVSGYAGKDSHHFFKNKELAEEFINNN